uniref:Uncharacterized protein n=1 Tax=Babesia bovis TaxID=5865 RepID=S6BN94_BABBO|nr:hypothetical protein [Babesia bovis]
MGFNWNWTLCYQNISFIIHMGFLLQSALHICLNVVCHQTFIYILLQNIYGTIFSTSIF